VKPYAYGTRCVAISGSVCARGITPPHRGPKELDAFIDRFSGYKRAISYSWPMTSTANIGEEETAK
jgi:hypothetical protein